MTRRISFSAAILLLAQRHAHGYLNLPTALRSNHHHRRPLFSTSSLSTKTQDNLPGRSSSFRHEPFTWSELIQIVQVDKNLAGLCRSPEDQERYDRNRVELNEQWHSLYDFILWDKLKFERILIDGKWQSDPQLSDISTVHKSLVPNDYPYFVGEGVEHYVLWKTLEKCTPEDIEDAKTDLSETKGAIEFIHWVNPPHLQSLPGIDHTHILCLLEDK